MQTSRVVAGKLCATFVQTTPNWPMTTKWSTVPTVLLVKHSSSSSSCILWATSNH